MRNKIKRTLLGLSAIAILVGGKVVFSEPGSESDPLVTLSYVNKSIDQVKYYIDDKIANIKGGSTNNNELVVVELDKGQSLIGGAGTEMILRGGKGKAIASELGGLADVTAGTDIGHNKNIPANHLLIIARNDGRGIYATTDAIFMVRGVYEIR